MVNGIKKEKILKRTNRKQNFKKLKHDTSSFGWLLGVVVERFAIKKAKRSYLLLAFYTR